MKILKLNLGLLLLLFSYSLSFAQSNASAILSIDRIFGSGEFMMDWSDQMHWMDRGKAYTMLEQSEEVLKRSGYCGL